MRIVSQKLSQKSVPKKVSQKSVPKKWHYEGVTESPLVYESNNSKWRGTHFSVHIKQEVTAFTNWRHRLSKKIHPNIQICQITIIKRYKKGFLLLVSEASTLNLWLGENNLVWKFINLFFFSEFYCPQARISITALWGKQGKYE